MTCDKCAYVEFPEGWPRMQRICSGQCGPCDMCLERSKYTLKGLARCFDVQSNCPLAKQPPTFWDIVVGIPLEDWMAADTIDEINRLIRRRDERASA